MQDHERKTTERYKKRRRGQTLAEFGLTLPILLLLVFGVIEFGRLFQAWVTLQNAAREATRYATTGQYNEDRYTLLTIQQYRVDPADPNSPQDPDKIASDLVPCVAEDRRGNHIPNYQPDPLDSTYTVEIYEGDVESLYATWYDGEDCDPTNDEHFERRKDIARILSIYEEARRSAAGISLEDNPLETILRPATLSISESVRQYLMTVWERPLPRSDQTGWFDVTICSSRQRYFRTGSTSLELDVDTRFVTVLDGGELSATNAAIEAMYEEPFCMLNEIPPTDASATVNAGTRWLDPGAPGDRVTISVRFNHPLITPIGVAEYVQMEARRAGVNESFRASRALSAVQGSSPGAAELDTPTPIPDTATPLPTASSTPRPLPTSTPTNTLSPTPGPFECQGINVSNVSFRNNRMFIEIENLNTQTTILNRVDLNWRVRTETEFQNRYLGAMALNTEPHWVGNEVGGTGENRRLDTQGFTGDDFDSFESANRDVVGEGRVSLFEATYLNSGNNLGDVFNQWDFGGSVFYFMNFNAAGLPDGECPITLELPPDPIDYDPPPDPNATDTYTPDCASSQVRVEWGGFDTFGVVVLRVYNDRPNAVADLRDFTINWPQPSTLGIAQGILTLRQITVGGSNPDDPNSVPIWQHPGDGDELPTTVPGEGSFIEYSFPPLTATNLYLDFAGTSSNLRSAFGVEPYMFNGTQFDIGCGSNGGSVGGTGGGGGGAGSIFLATSVPPPDTNTPRPSNTPGPTRTPTPTRPTNTPSNTWTPGPTRTPSNTPTLTLTPTNTSRALPPTPIPSGGGE